MKTLKTLIFVAILALMPFVFNGCGGSKNTTKSSEPKTEPKQTLVLKPENLVIWKEELLPSLNKSDLLYFYNTYEIELSGSFPKLDKINLKDGALSSMDTIFYVTKIVPAYTIGRVEDIQRDEDGTIIRMSIWFDYTDGTYKLNYTLEDYARWEESENAKSDRSIILNPIKDSGSFILNANARLLFKGQEADATATVKTMSNNYDNDRLQVKKTGKLTPQYVKGEAKGRSGGAVNQKDSQSPLNEKDGDIKTKSKKPYYFK